MLNGQYDTTPLNVAAMKGHKEVITLLLDRGAHIEISDYVSS
jgi:ankyrin repeat protein